MNRLILTYGAIAGMIELALLMPLLSAVLLRNPRFMPAKV